MGHRCEQVGPELVDVPIEEIEAYYRGQTPPEAIRMFLAIMTGSRMESGDGWFGPCQSRYGWEWLAARHHQSPDQPLEQAKFIGPVEFFERLDRNRDGHIDRGDLDWSDRNPWVQHAYLVNRLFRRLNTTGDGRLTREQWLAFFDAAAGGPGYLTSNSLRDAWLSGMHSSFLPGDAPSRETLLAGFFAGELGSMQEGPAVEELAPDFELETFDGRRKVQLSSLRGDRPVVLCFGNFTCGPFRSMYPGVEENQARWGHLAHFLAIYVREAHPTGGWAMRSNEMVGISEQQPSTYAERIEVAGRCHARLNPTIPLLVDAIDDRVGHAYSAMPTRLYIIDRAGRVAYKGGRGPYGFKTGEMEQALLMTLLDETSP
ncbi:MAG: deiodinase family protein [Pirellulales bacterium]